MTVDWAQLSKSYKQITDKADKVSDKPTAFETYARRLRFQALGKACYQGGLEALLLGHHQDDTIETVMWRLAMGSPLPGLNGIQSIVRIPECHGIFGVSESGSSVTLPESKRGKMSSDTKIATGGIYLCRPLLSFPKSQLLDTCHTNNIPYVSDPTNFDPTLTPRNSIRSIISEKSLPVALQAPRILSLIESSRDLVNSANELSDKILSTQCRILDEDLPAGTITIEFDSYESATSPFLKDVSPEKLRQVQCLVLRRITDLVSPMPYNHFPLPKFGPFVSRVFDSSDRTGYNMKDGFLSAFSAGGVMFTPMESSASKERSESKSKSKDHPTRTTKRAWRLSRRPFSKAEVSSTSIEVPLPRLGDSGWEPGHSDWVLWDNRYWFRVSLTLKAKGSNVPAKFARTKSMSFQIRPFGQKDYLNMVDAAPLGLKATSALNNLRKLFVERAPGKARFMIPTITSEDPNGDLTRERLLALPTFDFDLCRGSLKKREEILHNGVPMVLSWSWMFKMIDTDVLRLMGRPVEAEAAIVQ